jgi:hypothetical protein
MEFEPADSDNGIIKWAVEDGYDTAAECRKVAAEKLKVDSVRLKELQGALGNRAKRTVVLMALRCLPASFDPRK